MPDDQAQNQGPAPAPAAVDNRKVNLIAGLNELSRAIPLIPAYADPDYDSWTQLRNTHWLPVLQKLDELCQACAELYPMADVTQHHQYHYLRGLIVGDLCDKTFQCDLFLTASSFSTYRYRFETIPDADVRRILAQITQKLKTASDDFTENVRNIHYHSRKP